MQRFFGKAEKQPKIKPLPFDFPPSFEKKRVRG